MLLQVSAGMTLEFIQLIGTAGEDAVTDADVLASDTESIYVCGKWAFGPNNPTPFVAKYNVSGSGLVEAWKKEAVTSATFLLEALCRVDAATNQVHVASSYPSTAGNNVLVQAYASADGSLNWPLSPAPFTVLVGQTLATSLQASSDPGRLVAVGRTRGAITVSQANALSNCPGTLGNYQCDDTFAIVYDAVSGNQVAVTQIGSVKADTPVTSAPCASGC